MQALSIAITDLQKPPLATHQYLVVRKLWRLCKAIVCRHTILKHFDYTFMSRSEYVNNFFEMLIRNGYVTLSYARQCYVMGEHELENFHRLDSCDERVSYLASFHRNETLVFCLGGELFT